MTIIQKLALAATAPLLLGAASTTTYQPSQFPIYVVESVECIQATSGSSTDSVYLSRQPDGVRINDRNYSMSAGSKKDVRQYFYPRQPGTLVLMEDDSFTGDDEIGRFKYHLGEASGTYTVNMQGDGGEYIVTISVRR